jgi:hypothetical protein
MTEPLEIDYFQLVDGVSYNTKIVNGKLKRTTPLVKIDTVSSKALDLSQIRVEWIEE